jgi:hypothetical protein
MAGLDDGITRRVAHALQEIRRGQTGVIEIRGSLDDQELARTVVADYISVFELDVVLRDLPDGFRVEVRNPDPRTIELDL